jgi:hypothetical protein
LQAYFNIDIANLFSPLRIAKAENVRASVQNIHTQMVIFIIKTQSFLAHAHCKRLLSVQLAQ